MPHDVPQIMSTMRYTFHFCSLLLSVQVPSKTMIMACALSLDFAVMYRHMMPPDQITTTMLECCKDAVRLAARHKDLNLQA